MKSIFSLLHIMNADIRQFFIEQDNIIKNEAIELGCIQGTPVYLDGSGTPARIWRKATATRLGEAIVGFIDGQDNSYAPTKDIGVIIIGGIAPLDTIDLNTSLNTRSLGTAVVIGQKYYFDSTLPLPVTPAHFNTTGVGQLLGIGWSNNGRYQGIRMATMMPLSFPLTGPVFKIEDEVGVQKQISFGDIQKVQVDPTGNLTQVTLVGGVLMIPDMRTDYKITPITTTPTPTGNTTNLDSFVIDPNGDIYFVDYQGDSFKTNNVPLDTTKCSNIAKGADGKIYTYHNSQSIPASAFASPVSPTAVEVLTWIGSLAQEPTGTRPGIGAMLSYTLPSGLVKHYYLSDDVANACSIIDVTPVTVDTSDLSFELGTIVTGIRYPDYGNIALTNTTKGIALYPKAGTTQVKMIEARLVLSENATATTTLDIYVNNAVIGSVTVASGSKVATIALSGTYNAGDLFSVEFSAVGVGQTGILYISSLDI
jgi:hypothetical protein